MKQSFKMVRFVLLFAFILVLAACGNSGEQTNTKGTEQNNGTVTTSAEDIPEMTFKLAHITPTDHMWHQAAEKFNEKLQELSGGKLSVEIYPASQLGTEADMVQQVEAGSLDFALITGAYLSARTPEMAAWFAPYAFDSLEEVDEASRTDVAREILAKVEGTGLKGLDYLFAGQRVIVTKDKEIKTASDLNGLKIRVTPSPPLTDFYKSTGAAPESLPLPEVYSALQTGVIDGMDMDLDATITNKYSEVTKYVAVTNHMVWPSVIVTNESKYNSLPPNVAEIVNEALQTAIQFSVETRSAQEEEFKAELASQGMTVYELDKEVFNEQIEQFDETYSGQSELIKEFIETFRD